MNLCRTVSTLGTCAACVGVAMRPYGLAWHLVVASALLLLGYSAGVGELRTSVL